jgi:hypothetical protein
MSDTPFRRLLERIAGIGIWAASVVLTLAYFYGMWWFADWLFGPWWPLGLLFVIGPLMFVGIMLLIFFGKQRLNRR